MFKTKSYSLADNGACYNKLEQCIQHNFGEVLGREDYVRQKWAQERGADGH